MVEYKYNAWGTQLSRTGELANTLGYANPFRYRGYIYDDETWMYWLRSRYYYPELHRFINADSRGGSLAVLISHNPFVYCSNAPVMLADPDGHLGILTTHIKTAAANAVKNMFFNMVDWVAQRAYARRDGKMTSFNVAKKYITRNEEDSHNSGIENIVKWSNRIISTAVGYASGDILAGAALKVTAYLSPSFVKAMSTVVG